MSASPESPCVRVVSVVEQRLVLVARALVGIGQVHRVLGLLDQEIAPPRCFGTDAVELVKQTLSQGLVALLARAAWQQRPLWNPDTGKSRMSRGWELPSLPVLQFSEATFEFLVHLSYHEPRPPGTNRHPWRFGNELPVRPLPLGDQLVFWLAFKTFPNQARTRDWAGQPLILAQPLTRWVIPQAFDRPPDDDTPIPLPDFHAALAQPDFSALLELLRDEAIRNGVQAEWVKHRSIRRHEVETLATRQREALDGFLDALDQANRRDLGLYLLPIARQVLPVADSPRWWGRELDFSGLRLADRAALYEQLLVLPHALQRLGHWNAQARRVGYLDDDYTASQFWKARWEEEQGDSLVATAANLLRELDFGAIGPSTTPPRSNPAESADRSTL